MDVVTLTVLALIAAVLAAILFFYCAYRFEAVLLLLVASPWISSILELNNPQPEEISTGGGGGAYPRIALLMLLGIVGLVTFFRGRVEQPGKLPLQFKLLAMFLIVATMSTIYSIDQLFTFVRSISFVALFAIMLGFYLWLRRGEDFDRALNTFFVVMGIFVVLNMLALLFLPGKVWAFENARFQGLATQPNEVSGFFMLTYPVFYWKYARSKALTKLLVALLMAIMMGMHVLTGSRGGLGSAVICIGIYLLGQRKFLKLLVLGAMAVVVIGLALQFKPGVFQREGNAGATDLTGRDEFWHAAYVLIRERPVLGYGYAVEGKVWADPRFNDSDLGLWSGSARTSLHNGYISIAIGGGVPMLLLWCTIMLIPYWRCLKLPPSEHKAFIVAVMSMLLLSNFIETAITGTGSSGSLFFWLMWVMASRLVELADFQDEPAWSETMHPIAAENA
jgi:O-antigen ligase